MEKSFFSQFETAQTREVKRLMEEGVECCGTCKFYYDFFCDGYGADGQCRINPPMPGNAPLNIGAPNFPSMSRRGYCGKWTLRPKKKEEK